MFVQLGPSAASISETMCSLNFAARVRNIELGPAKQNIEDANLLKYREQVLIYKLLVYLIILRPLNLQSKSNLRTD